MAQIVSISINEQIAEDMDFLQKQMGFSGRSEIVRAGIRNLISEYKKIEEINGEVEGTLIVTHKEQDTDEFARIKHEIHHLVKTHIHHEIKNHNCMEIMLFKGKSNDVKDFYKKFASSKKIDSLKIIIY